MEHRRFDDLTRLMGRGASRRSIIKALLGFGGVATAATVDSDGIDARTLSTRPSLTTSPPSPPPPTTTTPAPRCGPDEEQCPFSTVCCPAGACARSGNQAICCTGTVCGLECCDDPYQCCDRECCADGHVCLGRVYNNSSEGFEEHCCPAELTCDGQCCDGECYVPEGAPLAFNGYPFNLALSERACCPAGSTVCQGFFNATCCDDATEECCVDGQGTATCIPIGGCCQDAQCDLGICHVCDLSTFQCVDDSSRCAGGCQVCDRGQCVDDNDRCEGECAACDQGQCVDDASLCPEEEVCRLGECCLPISSCCEGEGTCGERCCTGRALPAMFFQNVECPPGDSWVCIDAVIGGPCSGDGDCFENAFCNENFICECFNPDPSNPMFCLDAGATTTTSDPGTTTTSDPATTTTTGPETTTTPSPCTTPCEEGYECCTLSTGDGVCVPAGKQCCIDDLECPAGDPRLCGNPECEQNVCSIFYCRHEEGEVCCPDSQGGDYTCTIFGAGGLCPPRECDTVQDCETLYNFNLDCVSCVSGFCDAKEGICDNNPCRPCAYPGICVVAVDGAECGDGSVCCGGECVLGETCVPPTPNEPPVTTTTQPPTTTSPPVTTTTVSPGTTTPLPPVTTTADPCAGPDICAPCFTCNSMTGRCDPLCTDPCQFCDEQDSSCRTKSGCCTDGCRQIPGYDCFCQATTSMCACIPAPPGPLGQED